MNEIINPSSNQSVHSITATGDRRAPIALPELPIKVRLATNDDIPFMDELQKKNNRNLGFMPRGTLEGKIRLGEVLVAEEVGGLRSAVGGTESPHLLPTADCRPQTTPLGYLIGNDRYFKRDELGCIFQLCVVPSKRRGLIGASLLKSLFERASYGTRLYCCWCAQDLDANHFWKSMGFIPLAFRSGSRNKIKGADGKKHPRVHIYWIKRIRSGDVTTPLWYPSQTSGGAIGEDRLVLPIPPGVHWSEVKSVVLPGESPVASGQSPETPLLESLATGDCKPATKKAKRSPAPVVQIGTLGGWGIGKKVEVKTKKVKTPKEPRVKQKNDPAKVKAARLMRDVYLEEINANPTQNSALMDHGKYDVSRMITSKVEVSVKQVESKVVGMIAA